MDKEQDLMTGSASEHESASQIKSDIDQTRAQMDRTIDRLSDRLRPRALIDDLIDLIRGERQVASRSEQGSSTTARALKSIGLRVYHEAREHPIPAALIGAGIAYAVYERTSSRHEHVPTEPGTYGGSYVDARTGQPYATTYGEGFGGGGPRQEQGPGMTERARDIAGRAGEAVASAGSSARQRVAGAAESVKGAAGSVAGGVSSAASSAAQGVRSAAEGVKQGVRGAAGTASAAAASVADRASEAAHRARESAMRAGQRVQSTASNVGQSVASGARYSKEVASDTFDDYPLLVGGGMMVLGLLAGLSLPATRREDQVLGQRADQMKEKLRTASQEVMERGKQVAAATVSAATEEAQSQGLSVDSLAERAGRVASEVRDTLAQKAEEEGFSPQQMKDKARNIAERTKEAAKSEMDRAKNELKPK